jgi:zinc D-Ala-D-Ala carboxypeptidase
MSYDLARAARHTRSTILAALLVVGAAVLDVCQHQSLAGPSSPTTPTPPPPLEPRPAAPVPSGTPGGVGKADGIVPDGLTGFNDEYPAVTKLDPALRSALQRATTDAAGDRVEIFVTSGWRSKSYQRQLLREAVSRYGSEAEAARHVATAETSPHVSGDGVDIGPARAAAWLSKHGTRYGLCQIYRNEPWHYELRPRAIHRGCPPMYADPTRDPRMR